MKQLINKNIKVLFVLVAMFTSSIIYAQPQNGGQQGPPPLPNAKQIKEMVSKLADEISLSETQEEQVLNLYTLHFQEVEEKTENGQPNREEMETLKTTFENNVKAVLTKEQQKEFDVYIMKNMQKQGNRQRPQR